MIRSYFTKIPSLQHFTAFFISAFQISFFLCPEFIMNEKNRKQNEANCSLNIVPHEQPSCDSGRLYLLDCQLPVTKFNGQWN